MNLTNNTNSTHYFNVSKKRAAIIAILSGFLGLTGLFLSFQISVDQASLNFTWSIIFPLMITLSYGKLYGLMSVILGGTVVYPFIVGYSNGWASLVPALSLIIWIYAHGWAHEKRLKSANWTYHPISIQFFYSFIRFALYQFLFQRLLALNPPFWNSDAITFIQSSTVTLFLVRGLIMEWLLLAIAFVALRLPFIKKILGLSVDRSQRYNTRLLTSILLFGMLFMFVFTQIQYNLFSPDASPQFELIFNEEVGFILFLSSFIFILISGVTMYFLEQHLSSQTELNKTALRYQSIFENMDDLYFECDEEGTVLNCSPSVLSVTGKKRDNLINQSFFELIGKERDKQKWLLQLEEPNAALDSIVKLSTDEGVTRYWSVHLKKIRLGEREDRLVSVVRDFTDYQKAVNDLQELNETLELRISERTAELNASLDALERFVYVVSHDLKTPVKAIRAYSDILIEDEQDSLKKDSLKYLKQLKGISSEMIQFIESLLSYAMLGNKKVEKETVEIERICDKIISRLKLIYPETVVSIAYTLNEGSIEADPIMFQQLLTNIFENSFKNKKEEQPLKLTVSLTKDANHQNLVVCDNGVGIDSSANLDVFELFQTNRQDSSGIGLATVKRIMSMHDGTVSISGEKGEGTFVSLRFSGR